VTDALSSPPIDRSRDPDFSPRAMCFRCMRPERVCFCAHVPSIASETRVLIVQHPREELMPIGTARMASLCLPSSTLVVGTSVEDDPRVRAALDDPARQAILLWPGPGARDLETSPPDGPVTLVVVDGTWSLAKKLVRLNPRIAALPRYALAPTTPSEYRIRPEPSETCVSTIEAVMHALGVLERDPERFTAMMRPFRAMVDMQIDHEERLHGARVRARAKKPRPRKMHAALRRGTNLVVVNGEANAWPREPGAPPDELLQWVAVRLDTGERFEVVIRPERPLSPATALHTRLASEEIAAGIPREEALARWRAFVRDDETVVGWGFYAAGLLKESGGFLPEDYVDLRCAATQWLRRKPGAVEDFAETLGVTAVPEGRGRGGARLGMACAVTRALVEGLRALD
jgi:DTW domain-containing protein YfiP